MKWNKYPENKPNHKDFCAVYGAFQDRYGNKVKAEFDFAFYWKDKDYFTIGTTVGELFLPDYWLEIPKLPELDWPDFNIPRK